MNEITVCIPIFNGARTIVGVLERLTMQRVGSPLSVYIMDNGSTDGTNGLLSELAATKFFLKKPAMDRTALDVKYFQGTHFPDASSVNSQRTRKLLSKMAQTKYIFFLDSDVILPPACLYMMLDEFKRTEGIGELGCRYEADCSHNHTMMGATLWEKSVFDKIPEFTSDDAKVGCECNFCVKEVEKLGLKSQFTPNMMAYHCKYF